MYQCSECSWTWKIKRFLEKNSQLSPGICIFLDHEDLYGQFISGIQISLGKGKKLIILLEQNVPSTYLSIQCTCFSLNFQMFQVFVTWKRYNFLDQIIWGAAVWSWWVKTWTLQCNHSCRTQGLVIINRLRYKRFLLMYFIA